MHISFRGTIPFSGDKAHIRAGQMVLLVARATAAVSFGGCPRSAAALAVRVGWGGICMSTPAALADCMRYRILSTAHRCKL
jgi:hypothetical protein